MNVPIIARIELPCILRSPASLEAKMEGVTEELARDLLRLRVPQGSPAQSLRPRMALVVDIELPAAEGRSVRYLECVATVHSAQLLGDFVHLVLDVASMNFIAPRTAAGGRPQP